MEWREQSSVSSEEGYSEAQRWIEAATKKKFGNGDFRSALENGVLLCDLINKIKPGTIKRVNRLPTPIAGLDNLNVFLKACGKLGLKEAQLFHPGDLQDLSTRVTVKHQETNRRLKNVLITIYWLGRRAQSDPFYDGPYLNFKAFEGLLGTALYKALQESNSQKGSSVRDSGFGDSWYSEREEIYSLRGGGGGRGGHRRDDSLDSLDSLGSRPHSISSDATLKGSSEGCCSDTEADSIFRMADNKNSLSYRRSLVITPKASAQFNQFLPTKDKQSGYVPAPLRKKRAERNEDSRRSWASSSYEEDEATLTSCQKFTKGAEATRTQTDPTPISSWTIWYTCDDSEEDDDDEVGYADPVQDDLYARKIGAKPQRASSVSYNKFLPKFWTPEEDVHVQKIKLGSQRRPWYKEMQGFSAFLCSTTSQTPMSPEIPPLVFAPVDPASGPRLVKGEKWPLLGREDPREPPDPIDYESIDPDLENDDMFARRTLSFQSNADLAAFKTRLPAKRRLHSSEPQLNIVTRQHLRGDAEGDDFPDIERDDVVYRREKTQRQRALSGAPDNYAPMHVPEPWALPADLKARLLCAPCPLTREAAAAEQDQAKNELQPEKDDMLVRKLRDCSDQSQQRGPLAGRTTPSVPSSCSKGDLQRWQAIREASQLRYKRKLLLERLLFSPLLSSLRSKSTSDIQVDPSIIRQNRLEELQKYREQIKESEDKWQDDLSKWKNRRRSVNSDIVKKKEEREKIEQITYGRDGRSKSFKEIQGERHSIGSRLSSLSYLDDDDDNLFEKPVIRAPTRSLPPRSYTIDAPSYETVDGPAARNSITTTTTSNQSPAAASYQKSPAEEREAIKYTEKTTRDVAPRSSFASTQKELEPRSSLLGAPTGVEAPSSSSPDRQPQSSSMEPKPPAVSRVSASLPRSYQRSDSARLTSVVTPRPFGTQPSRISSLSRAHTTDESHKGVNGNVDVSKKASVPSRYHQYMTSEDEAQSSSAHSSDDEEEEEEEEEESTAAKGLSSTQSIRSLPSPVKSDVSVSPAPGKETSKVLGFLLLVISEKEDFCEMRISLNQKPNSSRDFGFQAAWDSTGARVTSIQPGSSAEMCQLQDGDEVLTVNGLQVAQMSYEQWKSSLEEALQKGSLVMDVRRHGQHSESYTKWLHSASGYINKDKTSLSDALMTLSLSLQDVASNRVNGDFQDQPVTMRNKESEPISLKNLKRRSEFFEQGGSESAMPDIPVPAITPASSSRWSWNPEEERKRQEKWQKEQELLLQEKYKRDQEKLQEEWLKAQQEIVTSVGHQQVMKVNSHGAGPHSPPSSLQQPTLWEDGRKSSTSRDDRTKSQSSPQLDDDDKPQRRGLLRQPEDLSLRLLEEELRIARRKRQSQKAASELEWRNYLRYAEAERGWLRSGSSTASVKSIPPSVLPLRSTDLSFHQKVNHKCDVEGNDAMMQINGSGQESVNQTISCKAHEVNEALFTQHNYTVSLSSLGAAMGSSTPDGKSQQPLSQAELERQQILNEMKKKTPLLTDSSWIRQRAAGTAVSRDGDVPPMRRGESLDNLDSSYDSRRSSWTPRSSSFASNYSRPYSAYSGSSSFYTGASGPRRPGSSTLPPSFSTGSLRGGAGTYPAPWSRTSPSPSTPSPSPITSPEPAPDAYQQRNRSVSGRKTCTFCDTPLGKGAAMIIESLGLCYHLSCFKKPTQCIDCKSDLGGSEAGAEVRIRNKQLFCNTCYMRVKTGHPTSM
uniref:LIM domain 7a n=1 Tax=Poecilia formosa TaxID=48698 RepID=A0A087XZV0_POEFO